MNEQPGKPAPVGHWPSEDPDALPDRQSSGDLGELVPEETRDQAISPEQFDALIEMYKRGVDRSLLRENLRKSAEERVLALMALQKLADEARRAEPRDDAG